MIPTEKPSPYYLISEAELQEFFDYFKGQRDPLLAKRAGQIITEVSSRPVNGSTIVQQEPAHIHAKGKHEPHYIQCNKCNSLVKIPNFPDHDKAIIRVSESDKEFVEYPGSIALDEGTVYIHAGDFDIALSVKDYVDFIKSELMREP